MNTKSKEIIRRAMSSACGDDLERANNQFGRMSADQLKQKYGQSGKTCQEIWDSYKNSRVEWETANRELENLLKNS